MRVFVIAGEPSGDALGAALLAGLKTEESGTLELAGVGGPLMRAEGLASLFPMDQLSVMGVAEVLPRLPGLLRRIRETADAVVAWKPDVLITIDSPDFCLRVARKARALDRDLKVVHYVAPSVWAWRPGRAKKMAAVVDHVLALLPFEPPYMEAAGMSCDFVGHPVTQLEVPSAADVAAFREVNAIGAARCLTVLPGSRAGEVGRVGPVLRDVAAALVAENEGLRVIVPTVGPRLDAVRELFAEVPGALVLGPDIGEAGKLAAFAASGLALAASGTVTLEVAAAGAPMIVAYDLNGLSRMIARRFVKLPSATLVNLLDRYEALELAGGFRGFMPGNPPAWDEMQDARLRDQPIPEFVLERCTVERILPEARRYLSEPGVGFAQIEASGRAMELLGRGGDAPGTRAARSVITFMGRREAAGQTRLGPAP
ncbi:lipid-A-disaccharide synthase [Algicella marina]|uniref:Lipid-A-disaccharide synthase n=1 Tax=Algicella marina TaxID=2683284 RepID=A0A6P1SZ22_9RHOB|nr:lipid-A-disaccharide synthase [Algicella marina]QHQ34721.1 lipid-A-disaccharide synthase [Algicella marina]